MSVHVEVNGLCGADDDRDYPWLGIMAEDDGVTIVLFEMHGHGTVVASECHGYPVAYYAKDWDMGWFEEFGGTVILGEKVAED